MTQPDPTRPPPSPPPPAVTEPVIQRITFTESVTGNSEQIRFDGSVIAVEHPCPRSTSGFRYLKEQLALCDRLRDALAASNNRLALALMELGRVPDPRIASCAVDVTKLPKRDTKFRAPVRDLSPAEVASALALSQATAGKGGANG